MPTLWNLSLDTCLYPFLHDGNTLKISGAMWRELLNPSFQYTLRTCMRTVSTPIPNSPATSGWVHPRHTRMSTSGSRGWACPNSAKTTINFSLWEQASVSYSLSGFSCADQCHKQAAICVLIDSSIETLFHRFELPFVLSLALPVYFCYNIFIQNHFLVRRNRGDLR